MKKIIEKHKIIIGIIFIIIILFAILVTMITSNSSTKNVSNTSNVSNINNRHIDISSVKTKITSVKHMQNKMDEVVVAANPKTPIMVQDNKYMVVGGSVTLNYSASTIVSLKLPVSLDTTGAVTTYQERLSNEQYLKNINDTILDTAIIVNSQANSDNVNSNNVNSNNVNLNVYSNEIIVRGNAQYKPNKNIWFTSFWYDGSSVTIPTYSIPVLKGSTIIQESDMSTKNI